MSELRIVALEEHFLLPEVLDAWRSLPADGRNDPGLQPKIQQALLDLDEQRIAAMDDQGVDVQVLSLNSPGLQILKAPDAVSVAQRSNDALAAAVAEHPDRFQGFVALPTADPTAAATELERSIEQLGFVGALINGRTLDTNCDAREFDDLYGTAERLGVPIYLHPQTPAAPVDTAYYSGYAGALDHVFATTAVGWHYETGVQLLRMIIGGVFDRFPRLQVVVGHWGEVTLFFLDRTTPQLDAAGLRLQRPFAEVMRQNIWITGGGILSERYLRWSVEVVGADRIMSATDYPWVDNGAGKARSFIEEAPLLEDEKVALASGNWDRLAAMNTTRRSG